MDRRATAVTRGLALVCLALVSGLPAGCGDDDDRAVLLEEDPILDLLPPGGRFEAGARLQRAGTSDDPSVTPVDDHVVTAVVRGGGSSREVGAYFADELDLMGWGEIVATCRRSAQSGDAVVTLTAASIAEGHRVEIHYDITGGDHDVLTIISARTHRTERGEPVAESDPDTKCLVGE